MKTKIASANKMNNGLMLSEDALKAMAGRKKDIPVFSDFQGSPIGVCRSLEYEGNCLTANVTIFGDASKYEGMFVVPSLTFSIVQPDPENNTFKTIHNAKIISLSVSQTPADSSLTPIGKK